MTALQSSGSLRAKRGATLWSLAASAVVFLISFPSYAGDAAQCIALSDSKDDNRSRALTNNCHAEVMVFWCHHGTARVTGDTACDPAKTYYRQQSALKPHGEPGSVKTNRYSLPIGADVTYGACFGSYGSFALLDNTGAYYCYPETVRTAGKDKTVMVQMAGQDQDKVCAALTDSASSFGRPGECACQTFGQRLAFCRMVVMDAKIDKPSLLARLKAMIRSSVTCEPGKDADCKPQPSRMVATGVRG